MKLSTIVAVAAPLGCFILSVFLIRTKIQLDVANAALASLKSNNADLSAHINTLESKVIDDAMLKRLQADQREAIKLRGEVNTLKNSLATAETKAAQKSSAGAKAPQLSTEQPGTNPYTRVLNRKVSANIGFGHGLLFGGWQSEPGKQAFAIAVPTRDSASGETVTIQTRLFEVSDEALEKLDKTVLLHATSQQATMTPDQLAIFLKTLESTPGIDILSAPRVGVFSGQQGTVYVGNKMPTPDGAMVDFGTKIDLVPIISADGSTIQLAVDAKLTLPNNPATP